MRTSPVAAADSTTPLGRGCKDLWVLSSTPVGQVSLLPPRDDPLVIRRAGADLPSRVAENLYWFGRQIERSDALARQLRTLVLRLTSETADGGGDGAAPLLRALAAAGQLEPDYAVQELRRAIPSLESALPGEIFNPQRSGSLRSAVDQMVQSASLVRDRLSTDAWRVLIGIERQMHPAHPRDAIGLTETLNRLNALIVDLAAIEGL